MSTAAALPTARTLPTPVSNLIFGWWMAIAFACTSAFLMCLDLPWGRLAFMGYFVLFAGILAVLAIGGWVGYGLVQRNPAALARCRLFSLVGSIAFIVGLIAYIAFKTMGAPTPVPGEDPVSFTGAANLFLVGSLLAALVVPPLMLGLFTWSLSMTDEVELYYHPPVETPEHMAPVAVYPETAESVPVVVDKSSVGTLMADDEHVRQTIEAHEAALYESSAEASVPAAVAASSVTPAAPFDTGSVHKERGTSGSATDPFETSSATGKKIERLAQEAQRLPADHLAETDEIDAVEASELLSSTTDASESVSAVLADEGSDSVLVADDEASALLASGTEDKPHASKTGKAPTVPANLDDPLSVGDLELTFDDQTTIKVDHSKTEEKK